MKQKTKKVCSLLFVVALALALMQASTVFSAEVSAQTKALSFITDAFQLDMSKYNAALEGYSIDYPSQLYGAPREYVTYNLRESQSNLTVICTFENKSLTHCSLYVNEGQAAYIKTPANTIEKARDILKGYQHWTGDPNSEKMMALLKEVDGTKTATTTTGDVTLKVVFTSPTEIGYYWLYTINGVEYTGVGIGFQGKDVYFFDSRSLYKIGDTTVKISKNDAIAIALKQAGNFSYTVYSGEKPAEISGLRIAESNITAELCSQEREASTLFPCWQVWLPLDHTYTGGVFAISVFVWADSGAVLSCTEVSGGEVEPSENTNASPLPQTTATPLSSPPASPETQEEGRTEQSLNMNLVAAVVIAIIVIIAAAIVLFKKRSK